MMQPGYPKVRRGLLTRFATCEDGSATIEACLWIPFFFAFFILILDATFIFARQADAQRIVQDGSRQYVTGALATEQDLRDWLVSAMTPISPNATATTTYDSSTGFLTTRVSYPAADTDMTGATGVLGGATMLVQSVQILEQ